MGMTILPAKMERALKILRGKIPFAPMGDPRKRYAVELTEPEINAIHAAFGFLQSAGKSSLFTAYADHYGPTMKALSERLEVFDDGNAPLVQ